MATKHNLTRAEQVYVGAGYDAGVFGRNGRKGVPVSFITKVDLGAPLLGVATGIVNDATGAGEAPNINTITLTADTQGSSPLDPAAALGTATINGEKVMVLDVPRNVTMAINTSAGTFTVTVRGYDEHKNALTESLSHATAATGKKAFKYIRSIALTSTGNEEAKTIKVGFGEILGLPYYVKKKSDVLSVWLDDAVDATATVVAGVTTTPSATTGDVRGTITNGAALDGVKTVVAYIHVDDPSTAVGLRGLDQYAG
jgi:hypothetical protein